MSRLPTKRFSNTPIKFNLDSIIVFLITIQTISNLTQNVFPVVLSRNKSKSRKRLYLNFLFIYTVYTMYTYCILLQYEIQFKRCDKYKVMITA